VHPRVEAIACSCGDLEHRKTRSYGFDVPQQRVAVEADRGGEIDFGDDREIGGVENRRILQRLVFAFGDREQHGADLLAEVVAGGADKVVDVLDEEPVEISQVPAVERRRHHLRVEMTDRAGRDLTNRGAGRPKARRVAFGRQVPN